MSKLPVTIIAEAAQGAAGDAEVALDLGVRAAEAGSDVVKFQYVLADELATRDHHQHGLFAGNELSFDEWSAVVDAVAARDKVVYFDVFGPRGLTEALEAGASGIKIHASDLQNRALLERVADSDATVVLGVGGSALSEVRNAIELLPDADVCMMLGHQGYPTPLEDNNLARLHSLRASFPSVPLGFAEHAERGDPVGFWLAAAAIGAGATVIEKHFTLAEGMLDSDAALLPDEFAEFVANMRATETAFGHSDESRDDLGMGPSETEYRRVVRKHVVAARDLEAGTPVQATDITLKRSPAGEGEAIFEAGAVVGRPLLAPVRVDEPITRAALESS